MLELVHKFDNRIFIPKIVPLVYDDTLSYYEFLCKVLNKMNEAIDALNALGLRVDDLEAAVAELQAIVSQFDERITQNERDISSLQGSVSDINDAIGNINTAIEGINGQIAALNEAVGTNTSDITSINSAISEIRDDIAELEELPTDISEIEGDISTLDGRVTTLESAAFGDISVSPSNWNVEFDMRSLSNFNFEIVNTAAEPTDDQTVTIREATPDQVAFYRDGDICYLKLKNFLVKPRYANLNTALLALVGSFAMECETSGQKILYKKEGVTLSTLIDGLSCTPADDGFARLQLVESEDGDYYDLHIYPVYGSSSYPYSWVNVNFFIFSPVSTFGEQQMDVCKFLAPSTKQIVDLINKNANISGIEAEIAEIEGDISDLTTSVNGISGDLSSYETSNNARVGAIETVNTQQGSAISSLQSSVSGATTAEVWDNFSDVFEGGNFPTNAKVNYFHMEKQNGIVYFEIAGSNFSGGDNFRYSSYYLGSIRSGLRSKLTPRNNTYVCFQGISTDTFGYGSSSPEIDVEGYTGGTNYSPIMPVMRGPAIACLCGSNGVQPYNSSSYYQVPNPAYGLFVKLDRQTGSSNAGTAFIIRGCYKTV